MSPKSFTFGDFDQQIMKYRFLQEDNVSKKKGSFIVSNPLEKQRFTYKEYKNWMQDSPKFTWKDYCSKY